VQKREFYVDAGVAEYWIVDPERREIRIIRQAASDVVATGELSWSPVATSTPLVLRLAELFDDG
ncbi:MAG TPA: Uma2 family endonuclease, partial [Gemmatimonadaceae bacterium]